MNFKKRMKMYKKVQNVYIYAEKCCGTVRESKCGLRNESDWSKNKQTACAFHKSGGGSKRKSVKTQSR